MRVVVIGSGIVGASAAYQLSRRGVAVTVVDGGLPGQATAAGAGIVCPWVDHEDDEAWYALTRSGASNYPGLMGELGADYARVGALLVAEDAAELEPVRALLRRRRAEAPEMGDISDVADPAGLFPPLASGLVALHVPGAARVDGRAVRDALLAAAIQHGCAVQHGAAAFTPDGGVLQGGAADQVPVPADAVVVAAGAWTGDLCRPLGVELDVFPRRGQIVHTVLDGVQTSGWPMVLPVRGPYLLGFPGSRVIVGATKEEAGFDARVTVAGLDEVLAAGLRLAPGLADATVAETKVGLRPVYAGERPLIARVTDRVVVATGMSAYGLTAGPFAGQLAATLALGEAPPLDVTPYGLHPA